jgi:hypothetical protein
MFRVISSSLETDNRATRNMVEFVRSSGVEVKGVGVRQKQGSGGNSYVAYLRSRRGCAVGCAAVIS